MIKGMESMLILLVMNLLVVFSAYLLASRCFKLKNAIDSWVLVFLLYFTQIILTELMLGIEGRLFLLKLLILNSAILFSVWMITRKRQSNILGQENFLEIISADKSLLLAICVLSGFALAKISINLVNPPFGWDSLNYHFTFPVEWLKNGNLNMPITINDDPSPPYYPLNGNLFFFWLMLPLKNVFLADLGQLPFFVVSFFLTFSISRKMGVSKELSFFSSCLFVLIPNFFKQLQVAYVDIMVAALFMAALNFLLSLKEEFSLSNVSAFAISLGLIIGTKTIALPYSALLLFPFLYLVIKNKCKPYFILTFISLVIALGGFTYIRNFITTGNPLYPMDYKLFGKAIFKGVMDAASYGAHFEGKDHSLTKILFHEGLGAQTLIFVLPALFAALPATIIKKKNCKDLLFLYILALPVLLFLTWRFLIPLANIRYLYPLLGVGMVAAFYVVWLFNIPLKIIKILVIICVIASIPELARRKELIAALLLSGALFVLLSLRAKRSNRVFEIASSPSAPRNDVRMRYVILSFFLGFFALIWLNQNYQEHEYSRYRKMLRYSGFWPQAAEAWEWLNSNTTGNNIAYVGRPVPFPLYGENFKNNVYYVSVNKIDPAKLEYYAGSHYHWGRDFLELHRNIKEKGNYRGDADYNVWLGNLARRKIEYLFVYSLHQTKDIIFPMEEGWAKANPDKFSLVFSNDIVRIYKLVIARSDSDEAILKNVIASPSLRSGSQ